MGQTTTAVARELGVSEPTVRKCRSMEDLSRRPAPSRDPRFPSLEGVTGKIDSWLIDDNKHWRKQRHTATRVYVQLRDEEGYEGSYSTARRCVHLERKQMAAERSQREAAGHPLLR